MSFNRLCVGGMLLVMAAGTPVCLAQAQTGGQDRGTAQERDQSRGIAVHFFGYETLHGTDIRNANDEEIGSVSDMIVDRGSGQIRYLVVKSGSFLGLGGRSAAVPYAAFGWNAAENRFTLDMTPEQFDRYPEFKRDQWDQMGYGNRDDALGTALRRDMERDQNDPYKDTILSAQRMDLEGTITHVDRNWSAKNGEHVQITVLDADGRDYKVDLGPSWYVMGSNAAPFRGMEFSGEIYKPAGSGKHPVVASEYSIDGEELTLRGEDRSPTWSREIKNSQGRAMHPARARYLLLSEVNGADVNCRGEDCGEVENLLIEQRSGRVAFLSIDPDENFLGIADTTRLVPWSVASPSVNETVYIDASKDMVLNSRETPDNIDEFGLTNYGSVYKTYNVEWPEFKEVGHEDWRDNREHDLDRDNKKQDRKDGDR